MRIRRRDFLFQYDSAPTRPKTSGSATLLEITAIRSQVGHWHPLAARGVRALRFGILPETCANWHCSFDYFVSC